MERLSKRVRKTYNAQRRARYEEDLTDIPLDSNNPLDRRLQISKESQLITNLLVNHLRSSGLTDDFKLRRASIYGRAIDQLSLLIFRTPMFPWLKDQADEELLTIATTLRKLFMREIPLKIQPNATHNDEQKITYNGYYALTPETQRRVIVSHQLQDSHSRINRVSRANSQIEIKDILGRSSRGKAIAGQDTNLRIGLRYSGKLDNPAITVSIDSGATNLTTGDLLSIRPLSQAIEEINKSYSPDTSRPYTFHFNDKLPVHFSPQQIISEFSDLNQNLSKVFETFAKK
ncbi:MAG: hypothetical protein WCV81_05075 [Microgenomates group bacterium]|jgi:hypothetical protein